MTKTILSIFLAVMLQYARAQNTWAPKASLTSNARIGAAGFSIGTKGYIGFGAGVSYGGPYYNDLWEWDEPTNTWTQMANCPGAGRMTPIAFAIGSKGYFAIGSLGQGNGFNDLWEWDQLSNTWTAKATFPGGTRGFAASFCIGTSGYICTGVNYPGGNMDDLWEYNSLNDTWQQKANLPAAVRRFAGGFSIDSKGYVGGGYGTTGQFDDFWEYEPVTNSWTQKATLPTDRIEFIAFSICGYGFWGTGRHIAGTSENDFWKYNPVADTWLQMADYPPGDKERMVAFAIGNKGYVGTGYCGDSQCGSTTNDFWEYTPDTSCFSFPVNASFIANSFLCPGTCTGFLNLTTNAASYVWSFPGGNPSTSTDVNPANICYNLAGTYDVQLIATNSSGSDTLLITDYITVYPYPPPQAIAQNGDTLIANSGAVSYQWYLNTTIINGATDYFYVAQGSGDYNVVATDSNGCEVEAVIFNVIAATSSSDFSYHISVYPNPVEGKLTINFPSGLAGNASISTSLVIYNIDGERIYSSVDCKLSPNGYLEVDCRHFSPGMYWLEVTLGKHILRAKFLKE